MMDSLKKFAALAIENLLSKDALNFAGAQGASHCSAGSTIMGISRTGDGAVFVATAVLELPARHNFRIIHLIRKIEAYRKSMFDSRKIKQSNFFSNK